MFVFCLFIFQSFLNLTLKYLENQRTEGQSNQWSARKPKTGTVGSPLLSLSLSEQALKAPTPNPPPSLDLFVDGLVNQRLFLYLFVPITKLNKGFISNKIRLTEIMSQWMFGALSHVNTGPVLALSGPKAQMYLGVSLYKTTIVHFLNLSSLRNMNVYDVWPLLAWVWVSSADDVKSLIAKADITIFIHLSKIDFFITSFIQYLWN